MINREAWEQAVASAHSDDPDAVTAAEFATEFSISIRTAQRMLAELVVAGKATPTVKTGRTALGGLKRVPAYVLKKIERTV